MMGANYIHTITMVNSVKRTEGREEEEEEGKEEKRKEEDEKEEDGGRGKSERKLMTKVW